MVIVTILANVIEAKACPGFRSFKPVGVFSLRLDVLIVNYKVTTNIKFAVIHFYTWIK